MTLATKISDARTLAKFVSLAPRDVEYFRRNYPDFVPQKWWDYQSTNKNGEPEGPKQWQLNQQYLHQAWKEPFDLDLFGLIRILITVFDPDEFLEVWLGVHPRPHIMDIGGMSDMCPYHRAIVFLNEQKWRVRLCERCKSPFVAVHNKQKYCGEVWNVDGDTCSSLTRKEQKRKDHAKHEAARNEKRRMEYARIKRILKRKKDK